MSFDDLHFASRVAGSASMLHQALPAKTAMPWRGCAKRIPLQVLANTVSHSVAQRLEFAQAQVASPLALASDFRSSEAPMRVVANSRTKRVGSAAVRHKKGLVSTRAGWFDLVAAAETGVAEALVGSG